MTRSIHTRLWFVMNLFGFFASLFTTGSAAAETKMVDPKSILFSTPTLNDSLPAFQQSSAPVGKLFQVHEDDWRQFEAVSTIYQDEINREQAAIRDVLATASVKTKAGNRELTAFRKVHVRKSITEPIKNGLLLSQIAVLTNNRTEYAGLSLSDSPAVVGGYAFAIDGVVIFGQADGDRVLSVCFTSNGSPRVSSDKARRLAELLRESRLTVVHWPSATRLDPNTDLVPYLTGTAAQQPDDLREQTRQAFEEELGRRGLHFSIDRESGRYRLRTGGTEILVSTENLERDAVGDRDLSRVVRFVDTVVATKPADVKAIDPKCLFWCFEPNGYVEKADYRKPISDRVDRVLVLLSADGARITWVTPAMLARAHLAEDVVEKIAFENLSHEMEKAKIEFSEIDGVRLGYLNTALPFKASLLLAPNLRKCVADQLGWPLMAVAPDRDFLYLWAAKHEKFVDRVGRTTVEEYTKASYPLSTEVYSISDGGIRAVGEFPSGKEKK